jgi:hypothetical protein
MNRSLWRARGLAALPALILATRVQSNSATSYLFE